MEEQYKVCHKTWNVKKLKLLELGILIAKALDVGLSLNVDETKDHFIKFQRQPQGRTAE